MEGWVDLGYPAMHRPGTELAISWSLVRRSTTTLTEQPYVLANKIPVINDGQNLTENGFTTFCIIMLLVLFGLYVNLPFKFNRIF